MASELARQEAARAWCTPETKHITMIPELAEAFANILDKIRSQPWLGNATTQQLQGELATREELGHMDPDYKTVGEDK